MRNITLRVKNYNFGLIGPGMWKEREWILYDDLTVDFFEIFNSISDNNKKMENYNLTQEQYEAIFKNIKLAKESNERIDASDGETWEFMEYNNGSETWKRELGYIYGITALENVSNCLKSIT